MDNMILKIVSSLIDMIYFKQAKIKIISFRLMKIKIGF